MLSPVLGQTLLCRVGVAAASEARYRRKRPDIRARVPGGIPWGTIFYNHIHAAH